MKKENPNFAIFSRDEKTGESGSGVHGLYLNAEFKGVSMLTLMGCNAVVELLKEWIPGIDSSK
jgi:hypothetical protein